MQQVTQAEHHVNLRKACMSLSKKNHHASALQHFRLTYSCMPNGCSNAYVRHCENSHFGNN